MRRKAAVVALLASFAVYLIPLIGPHAAPLLGEMFLSDMYRSRPLWFLTNIAVGVALQVITFTFIYLFLRKRNVARGFVLVIAAPAVFVVAQAMFMLWIPSLFLIESDTASDIGNWPAVCTANDAWIVGVPTPWHAPGESISEVLIETSKADYGVLSIPGCQVTPLALPRPTLQAGGHVDFTIGIDYFVPRAGLLFNKQETQTGLQTWLMARRGRDDFIPVELPKDTARILSSDGEWVSWIDSMQIVMRDIARVKPDKRIDLNPFGPANYVVANIHMRSGEIAVWRNGDFIVLGIDGQLRLRIPKPSDLQVQSSSFQKIGEGWFGWDAYRDEGPYQVAWSLPAGRGSHHVLRGRSINSVAVSPASDLIAISVTTSLNIGNIQDAVYVLRTSDGKEVFRRFLPRYTRTQVVFPDKDLLLYSTIGNTQLLQIR